MGVFSKTYRDPLQQKKIQVRLPRMLRLRIWMTLEQWNWAYDAADPFSLHVLDRVPKILKREHGSRELKAFDDDDNFVAADLERVVTHGIPSHVFDVIQVYIGELRRLDDSTADHVGSEINRVFAEEGAHWRLLGDDFVQVDSKFQEEQLRTTAKLLDDSGFQGALSEFREAQSELTAGDTKGAIRMACSAFESAMKTILGTESGTASQLARRLEEEGYFDDVPESVSGGFPEAVLMSLAFLGNRLGRHGQGAEVVDVPHRYAELAVQLSGTFINFCMRKPHEQPSDENGYWDGSAF